MGKARLTLKPAEAEQTVPLRAIQITRTLGGKEFRLGADEIAQLMALAARHASVYSITDGSDVNLHLRGLGALCRAASRAEDSDVDDHLTPYFIGWALTELAARLEVPDSPELDEYAVTVTAKASATKGAAR